MQREGSMTAFDDETLEAAAQLLERVAGNSIYQKAWRVGAKRIRSMKKLTGECEKLTDAGAQISSSSS
jgi:hypothetical protein